MGKNILCAIFCFRLQKCERLYLVLPCVKDFTEDKTNNMDLMIHQIPFLRCLEHKRCSHMHDAIAPRDFYAVTPPIIANPINPYNLSQETEQLHQKFLRN